MKATGLAVSLAAFLLASVSAHAQVSISNQLNNVQNLYSFCRHAGAQQTVCVAYIAGVADTLIEIGEVYSGKNVAAALGMCPGSASYGAFEQAFMNWAAKHPDKWGNSANDGVFEALVETWPCSQ